jgi:transposase
MSVKCLKSKSKIETWDRQPGETEKAFRAFVIYRDLGWKRSCTLVAKMLGKSTTLIYRWCGPGNWESRCEDFDRSRDRELQKKHKQEIGPSIERHLGLSRMIQSIVLEKLQKIEKWAMANLSISQCAHIMQTASMIERLSLGLTSEKVAVENAECDSNESIDLSKLTDEELTQFENLMGKISGKSNRDKSEDKGRESETQSS